MPAPPPGLEKLVGWFIPPSCREEVLGDFYEQYRSPLQYIGTAIRVVPCVIASRILRTTDVRVLLMDSLLTYAAFLCSAWWVNRQYLNSNIDLLILSTPALMILIYHALSAAWRVRDVRPSRLTASIFAVSGLLLVQWLDTNVLVLGWSIAMVLMVSLRHVAPPQLFAFEPQPPVGSLRLRTTAILAAMSVGVFVVFGFQSRFSMLGMFFGALSLVRLLQRRSTK